MVPGGVDKDEVCCYRARSVTSLEILTNIDDLKLTLPLFYKRYTVVPQEYRVSQPVILVRQ
jgi:hypothetical protein